MNAAEILKTLRELTERKEIEFLPLAKDLEKLPQWPPAARYIRVLSEGTKPETASEDLFTALCKELLKIEPSRQVIVRDGWVDFRVTEPNARPIPFELKSLFRRDGDSLRRYDANPDHYKDQIKNYLSEHEYLVLTDLRTTWLCSARDYFFEDKPFATVPFADFLLRCIECRSITDALRRFEDTTDKPELEQQFFEDLKNWFGEFDKIHWQAKDQAAEFIILLINKLIFAKTLEDFGLVSYRFIQNEFAVQKDRWEAKGPAKVAHYFLKNFEDFFDEYYDTEIFEERIWDKLVADDANFDRFCKKLEFILGLDPWNTAMGRGIVNYNYRRIDEDIFGKSYEMFLAAIRSKMSATVNMFYIYELPVPEISAAQKKKLAESAGKLLKDPRDVKERAALEVFIARELYSLSLEDWKHLTGTFTFGSGETKAELDEIIRQSHAHWQGT